MAFPVYVVSLLRSKERRRLIAEQLEREGVPFEFFDAYDATRSSEHELKQIATVEAFDTMTKGAIGCAQSHLEVYRIIAKSHPQGAVIIEDDIVVSRGFGQLCRSLGRLSVIRDSCVVHFGGLDAYNAHKIQLSTRNKIRVGKRLNLYKVEDIDRNFHGTFAYYISRSAAARLAAEWRKVHQPADLWYKTAQEALVRDFWMAFPSVCHHPRDASISEVETDARKNMSSSRMFLLKEIIKRRWYPLKYWAVMTYKLKIRS